MEPVRFMEENRKKQELWIFLVSWAKGTKLTKSTRGSCERNWTSDETCTKRHMHLRGEEAFIVLMNLRESIVAKFLFIQGGEFLASWRSTLPSTGETEASTVSGDKEKWGTLLQGNWNPLDYECIQNSSTYRPIWCAFDNRRNFWGVRSHQNVHRVWWGNARFTLILGITKLWSRKHLWVKIQCLMHTEGLTSTAELPSYRHCNLAEQSFLRAACLWLYLKSSHSQKSGPSSLPGWLSHGDSAQDPIPKSRLRQVESTGYWSAILRCKYELIC